MSCDDLQSALVLALSFERVIHDPNIRKIRIELNNEKNEVVASIECNGWSKKEKEKFFNEEYTKFTEAQIRNPAHANFTVTTWIKTVNDEFFI
jgi:hypothetical protein